jgi:8-oxo-dGTP diphosphatase
VAGITAVDQIDWTSWTPTEHAVLCFIRRRLSDGAEELMLIRKKRGLGAGKINGPGGRVDPGETPLQAAVRETQEEIGLTPSGIREAGKLQFQFLDGYGLSCTVFQASFFSGTPTETDEATPHWYRVTELPFDQMWSDDELWIPYLLEERYFSGVFVFDDEVMMSHRLEFPAQPA